MTMAKHSSERSYPKHLAYVMLALAPALLGQALAWCVYESERQNFV
jgi:hypothetical protein